MIGGYATRVGSRIHLIILGGLSGGSVLARWGIDVLSAFASRFDLVLVLFTLVTGQIETIAALEMWITWGMYGYLLFVLAPRLYPESVRTLVSPARFRALVAGFAFAVAMLVLYGVRLIATGRWGPFLLLIMIICLLLVLELYYLASVTNRVDELFGQYFDWPIYDLEPNFEPPPDEVVLLAESTFHPQDPLTGHSIDENEAMWLKAWYALTFPIPVSGLLVAILFLFSPVPELVLLAGIALLTLEARLHHQTSVTKWLTSQVTERTVDIEYRILANIGPMSRYEKGRTELLFVTTGAALSTFLFWTGIRRLESVELFANFGGPWTTGTALVFAGLFGFCYWLRTLLRLPAFNAQWYSKRAGPDKTRAADGEAVDRWEIPVRPRGFLLPTASLAVVGAIGWRELPWIDPHIVGLAWLGGMGLLLIAVWLTRQADPQAAASEWYAAPLGWVVQFASTAIVFVAVVAPRISLLWTLFFAVWGPRLFYIHDSILYSDHKSGFRGCFHITSSIVLCWYWCSVLVSGVFLFSSVWYLEALSVAMIFSECRIASKGYHDLQSW